MIIVLSQARIKPEIFVKFRPKPGPARPEPDPKARPDLQLWIGHKTVNCIDDRMKLLVQYLTVQYKVRVINDDTADFTHITRNDYDHAIMALIQKLIVINKISTGYKNFKNYNVAKKAIKQT